MQHPKEILQPDLVEQIRQSTSQTETDGELSPSVLQIIYEQQWFRSLIPTAYGGKELTLPQAVALFEALAWTDANVGWCVNLGAGANMFAGYFDEEIAKEIFLPAQTCCAGSGACSGKAIKSNGGYLLSGRWKYASGANHATHFTANALLLDENAIAIKEKGEPVFRSFIIPADKIINHKNWDAIGLRATSSNDFEAIEVWVPEAHTFSLLHPSPFATGPLYRFPFSAMAVVNMCCMISGIALHFIDLYQEMAMTKKPLHSTMLLKDNPKALSIFENTTSAFYSAREIMYQQLEKVWHYYEGGATASAAEISKLQDAAAQIALSSRSVINDLFPLMGMDILRPSSPLNKVWRDAATASQHYLLSPLLD